MLGDKLGDTPELRTVRGQATRLESDARGFTVNVEKLLGGGGESPGQTLHNAMAMLTDMRASINESFHVLALKYLDAKLRDNAVLRDRDNRPYVYQGVGPTGGITFLNPYNFPVTSRIVDRFADGLTIELHTGETIRLTFPERS